MKRISLASVRRLLLVSAVVVTAGCGSDSGTGAESVEEPVPSSVVYPRTAGGDLSGTRWLVYEYVAANGERTRNLKDTTIILEFGFDGTVSGTGGCNEYQARYEVSGDYEPFVQGSLEGGQSDGQLISFSELTTTEDVCAPDVMEQEAVYYQRLEEAGRWWIAVDTELFLGFAEGGDLQVGARPRPDG